MTYAVATSPIVASVSVLTPTGRGAVATVRVTGEVRLIDGPPPLFRAANRQPVSKLPIGRVTFGAWGETSSSSVTAPSGEGATSAEEVVVCRTADDVLEIHCHGGNAAVTRIVSDLESRGCRVLPSSAISETATSEAAVSEAAVSNTGESRVDRECVAALSRATTLRTADVLLQQQGGLLRETFEQLRRLKLNDAKRQVDELLAWDRFGVHLTEPWQVVLCGWPNVGKSSLVNALVGFSRSIVFDQPGTTRDVVTAETAFEGWPVVLSDTAGLREEAGELEAEGIERARQQIVNADLRVVLVDVSEPPHDDDRRLVESWPDSLVVAHKSDLPMAEGHGIPPHALAVSSLTGAGVIQMAEEIVRRLVPVVPPPMTPVPVTPRQVQMLREIRQLMDAAAPEQEIDRRMAALCFGSPDGGLGWEVVLGLPKTGRRMAEPSRRPRNDAGPRLLWTTQNPRLTIRRIPASSPESSSPAASHCGAAGRTAGLVRHVPWVLQHVLKGLRQRALRQRAWILRWSQFLSSAAPSRESDRGEQQLPPMISDAHPLLMSTPYPSVTVHRKHPSPRS